MKRENVSYFVGLEVKLKLVNDPIPYFGVLYYTGKDDIYCIDSRVVFDLKDIEYINNLKS